MKSTAAPILALLPLLAAAGQIDATGSSRSRGGGLAVEDVSQRLSERKVARPTVPPIPAPWNIEPKRCATGYTHVGCVKDTQFKMRRLYTEYVEKEDRETMTVEVCYDFCRNVSGAQFFGLENGRRCYCTPTFHSGGEVREEDVCDVPCEGDATQMCGGNKGQQDMYEMHDCLNMPSMPCKQPPAAFPHAKLFKSPYYFGAMTPCKNAKREGLQTGKNIRCEIECEEGYYVAENTLKCVEMGQRMTYSWGQVTGSASCEPVVCGQPKQIRYARYPFGIVEYPNSVTYACNLGFTLNGTAQGAKQQDVQCMADGKFGPVSECLPVRCRTCPTGPKYPNAVVREDGDQVYRDTCTYDCEEGYTLNQQADGKKSFTITCLHTGEFEEPPTCAPVTCGAAPNFAHARNLAVQGTDAQEYFPNEVKYECESGYSLDRAPGGKAAFAVSCRADGTFSPAPECRSVLVGNPPVVKHSTYDDREYYYGESVTYTCEGGYTMDGLANGPNMHTLHTAPTGQWKGQAPTCKPVVCGPLPQLAHATAVSPPPGEVNFATPPVTFSCASGYSTLVSDDIWSPNKATFDVSCKADGTFATKECVNIDDCAIRNCGSHGMCVDLPNPTNLPLDNYDCKCDSGYEVTLHNSTLREGEMRKLCTNINDCPMPESCGGTNDKGLKRGLCTDLINAYECTCGSGYKVAAAGGNQTCEPVVCGKVPPASDATYNPEMLGKTANYDTPTWVVTCNEGYSYDGQADGAKTTEIACQSTGTFTPSPTCVRVSCGEPTFVGNADMAPSLSEMLYEDSVTYTCDEGHALKGDAKGLRSWEIVCLGSGVMSLPDTNPGGEPIVDVPVTTKPNISMSGGRLKAAPTATTTPIACLPVNCGTLPAQEHATWNETREYVYGEAARVECDDGYSVGGSMSDSSAGYVIPCTTDGSFATTARCERVVCADPPSFDHSSYTPAKGPYKYEDQVTYSVEPGYELQLPNGSKINGTFECHCAANGEFNSTCAMDVTVATIDCGPAPAVEHATVTGSTHFGGLLTAKADTGYTIDGTATGDTEFTFYCQATGRFSARQSFQRIKCGLCPEIPNVEEINLIDQEAMMLQLNELLRNSSRSGLKTGPALLALQAQARKAVKRSGKRLFETKYGDVVDYICKKGFRASSGAGAIPLPVLPVLPTKEPDNFELTCALTGDHTPMVPTPQDPRCMPVTCDVHRAKKSSDPIHALFEGEGDFTRLIYQEKMNYACRPGLSLDGTPAGATEFTETCMDSGDMSKTNVCKDIDWCLISKCGEHGKCVDGDVSYDCECDPGYEVATTESIWQTCENIDECETEGGYDACSAGGGSCIDGLLEYKCKCTEGYENVETSNGHDSCAPVMCSALPVKEHAHSRLQTQKLTYGQSALYTCDDGYTLDGTVSGKKTFKVECTAQATNSGLENDCMPVQCESGKDVKHAEVVGEKQVRYGEAVLYQCDVGTTTNGQVAGSSNFSVPCLTTGKLGVYESCELITCGPALQASFATSAVASAEVLYDEAVAYTCVEGYSLDGSASGGKAFDATCGEDGLFKGMKSCEAVTCGNLSDSDMRLAQYSFGEFRYPVVIPVVCDAGATVDADADGESTFYVQCGAEGQYIGKKDCLPIKCLVPPTPKSYTSDKKGTVEYDTSVVFTCNPGYSTDGTSVGPTKFQKHCEATGSLSRSSPNDCIDIDFCLDSPCGANGVCKDSGVGVPAPGYTCECFEGYEVKKNSRGKDTCAADDCAGEPCGEGGYCTDLSKQGGPQGTYACTCDPGFDLVEPEPMKYTCRRKVCGVLPNVSHTEEIAGKPYSVQDEFGEPSENLTLLSFERATFQCASGYSTDQRVSPEGRSFSVKCQANGRFSRALIPERECLPVICENPFLPSITQARLTTSGVITYGELAEFRCNTGHTTTGVVGGRIGFSIRCLANGTFADTTKQCLPIKCDVPARANTFVSRSTARYGEKVTYTCAVGHHVPHPVSARLSFEGTCIANGTITTEEAQGCERIECGEIPSQPQATAVPPVVDGVLRYGDAVRYECLPGHTLGGVFGGDASYQIACQASGALTGTIGTTPGGPPAGSGTCKRPGYDVAGRVTDAQNASTFLENAKITFTENGTGNEVAIVYTDRDGMYKAYLPPGNMLLKAEMAGYIPREKGPLVVTGPLRAGQGTNLALSKTLPPNDWRVIVNWAATPQDLDSYTFFGCDLGQSVSFSARTGSSDRAGGLSVVLDRDVATGFGPETTTIRGAGRCTVPGCCLIQFKVVRVSAGNLGSSEAIVTVYKGEGQVAKYHVPPCTRSHKVWTVFTIDASNDTNRIYEGSRQQPPYLDEDERDTVSWGVSMDFSRWSLAKAPGNSGAAITGLNLQSHTKLHRLDAAKWIAIRDGLREKSKCKNINIKGTLEEQMWAKCPPGYYLSGLFRKGSRYDKKHGIEQLTKLKCCTAKLPAMTLRWGQCHIENLTAAKGWKECGRSDDGLPTAVVGLHASYREGNALVPDYTGPAAKHAVTSKGVYIGGEYIELGIRRDTKVGKMGTDELAPAGFIGRADGMTGIGMVADRKGFSKDEARKFIIDYFLPGWPAEDFWVGFKRGGDIFECVNCGEDVEDTTPENSPYASARVTLTLKSSLRVVTNITLGVNDKYFKTEVEVTNMATHALESVRYARTVDADNTVDQGGDFPTQMEVEGTIASDGYAAVSAKSKPGDEYYTKTHGGRATLVYFSRDSNAKASYDVEGYLDAAGAYDPSLYDSPPRKGKKMTIDGWMGMTFDFGTLSPGQSAKATFFTALDDASMKDIIKTVDEASWPTLALDKLECCSVGNQEPAPGGPACGK